MIGIGKCNSLAEMFKFIKNETKDICIEKEEAFVRRKEVAICNEFVGGKPAKPRRRGRKARVRKAPANLKRKG